ncbi:myeloid leukemia factor 2-like [Symsagittifera roscoffensis]|uniref:myeloid leukemia factor 2-like n=1 Tax=Symsagittifera roscoffensis TaxID=84072 RepID=UPI00307C799D
MDDHFPNFNEDPFFQPFGNHFGSFFGALEGPSNRRHSEQSHRGDSSVARQRDMFRDPFANMNRMMQEMSRGFTAGPIMPDWNQLQQSVGQDKQSYSYSSVMSFSNAGGQGEPKYFEATSSTRQGPGGVKETRKTVRDSESGLNKMAIGHHLNDRGHIVERSLNRRTNERDERQNFINMDESEAGRFNEEWAKATAHLRQPPVRGIENGNRGRRRIGHRNERPDDERAIDY